MNRMLNGVRERSRAIASLAAALVAAALVAGADTAASLPREPDPAPETKRLTIDPWGIPIEYRASDQKVADKVGSILKQRIPELSSQLGLSTVEPFRVFLIPDIKVYEERIGLALPPWGVAFAFAGNQMMLVDVSRATTAWNSLEKVIPHEVSHLLLAQRTGGVPMPLWFVEGLAQWQAGEWSLVESWRLMEEVWSNRAASLDRMVSGLPAVEENGVRDAYRVSYAGFQYRFDEQMDRLSGFLAAVAREKDFGTAFESYWGESDRQFYDRFSDYLETKYRSRVLLFQTGPLFTIVSLLFLLVVLGTWIRNRRKLKRMEESERSWSGQ